MNKKNISEILKIAFSCDGGVSVCFRENRIEPKVFIKCFNPFLMRDFSKLLRKFQINFKENDEGTFIRDKKSIIKYSKEIGFTKGVKIGNDSKRFSGVEKNALMQEIANANFNPFSGFQCVMQVRKLPNA